MSEEIRRSIEDVAQAIERLNQAFDKRTEDLRKSGKKEELNRWAQAKSAMRDSGVIYLSWARHYAKASSQDDDDMREDELFEFPSN